MRLEQLKGIDFRNLSSFEVGPGSSINVIFGQNGSGKTSLLESIYILGFGRSFRPGGFRSIVKDGASSFTVFASGRHPDSTQSEKLGLYRDLKGEQRIKINGVSTPRLSDLARHVPVQLFTPESVELITGSPSLRRQFLDWGVFHVEHSFFRLWSNYNKVLKHRNRLLKDSRGQRAKDDRYWTQQLATLGEEINNLRLSYLDKLRKYINEMSTTFLPNVTLDISLRSGWDSRKALAESLEEALPSDLKYGHTSSGPHKADLKILANNSLAKERLSRGQQKVLVASLKLAQAEHYKEETGEGCIILVDDLNSELDIENSKKLCQLLEQSDNQVFITVVNNDELNEQFKTEPKVFHVEHGVLKSHIEN